MSSLDQEQISIIIPFFHGLLQLGNCLDHLAENVYSNFNVILVDHRPGNSPPITIIPDSLVERTTQIRGSDSLWWTGAINLGLKTALQGTCSCIMFLNHDCYLAKGAIEELLRCTRDNPNSIVAPAQADWSTKKTSIVQAYTCYLLGFPTLIPPWKLTRRPAEGAVVRTGMIVGGRGVLIPRTVFDKVGLLDEEHLPHYGSDNDFYLRCKQKGFRLLVTTRTTAYIDSSQTTSADYQNNTGLKEFIDSLSNIKSHRNIPDQMALFRKHYPIPGLHAVGVFLNIVRYFLMVVVYKIPGMIRSAGSK